MKPIVVPDLNNVHPEHAQALKKIISLVNSQAKNILLAGKAGRGKTTLMKQLGDIVIASKRDVIQLAPTGKAAVRLKEKTGRPCNTIHSFLYGGAVEDPETGELIWIEPGINAKAGDLIIIDESSMVGTTLFKTIQKHLPSGVSVLFVGDNHQVEPVNDGLGVMELPADVTLFHNFRQSSTNPIVELGEVASDYNQDLLKWLRAFFKQNEHPQLYTGYHKELVSKYLAALQSGEDCIAICFSNHVKNNLNTTIRKELGYKAPIVIGDRILIKTNNHQIGMYNGDIFTVESVKYYNGKKLGKYALVKFKERKTVVKIPLTMINKDRNEYWSFLTTNKLPKNVIHAHYGYVITTHASQGSEWEHVFYYWEHMITDKINLDSTRKLLYTAFTRSSNKLGLFR